MTKEYCAWAGEEVKKNEHDCICKECNHCGGKLNEKNRWVMSNIYLHRKCILAYLEENGEIVQK